MGHRALARAVLASLAALALAVREEPVSELQEFQEPGEAMLQRTRHAVTPLAEGAASMESDQEEMAEVLAEGSAAVGGGCCSWAAGACGPDAFCNAQESQCQKCGGQWVSACCSWDGSTCGSDKWCNAKHDQCQKCKGGQWIWSGGGAGSSATASGKATASGQGAVMGDWPTAVEVVKAMGVGINFGQRFDHKANSYWANDYKAYIDSFAAAGFKHVRIPVTWGDHMWARGEQVNRMTDAVKHALSKGLWVMINTHHEFWLKDNYEGDQWLNDKFWKLWTDIATHFKDFSSKLVFEVLNEPEHKFGDHPAKFRKFDDPWGIQLTRKINKLGYDAIRKISPKRVVFISPNAQGNVWVLRNVYGGKHDLPDGGTDKYLGVTIHTYDPSTCCLPFSDNGKCYEQKGQGKLPAVPWDDLQQWSKSTGIPIHLGEYGIGRRHGREFRGHQIVKDYYWAATSEALKRGWSPCVWEDGGDFQLADGPYNWVYGLKDVIIDAARQSR
mmetsp:Transcript_10332/g.32757  ORF Transcript_10332/g.32757 Transcript_10332/m.32757 type:complete len:499 (+) Transcript_10332:126-1622(+)